jgi:hypothetical protein
MAQSVQSRGGKVKWIGENRGQSRCTPAPAAATAAQQALQAKAAIERAGAELALVGGELVIRAAKEELTDELVDLAVVHKQALRLLLIDQAMQRAERCGALAREVIKAAQSLALRGGLDQGAARVLSQIEQAVDGLAALVEPDVEPGDLPTWCWRCGAELTRLVADIAAQVAANLESAAWAGWPPELFRMRMREHLRRGDRVVKIRSSAITVRGSDGRLRQISRSDA